MRLVYDAAGMDAEREAFRLVILLSLVTSCRTILSLLEQSTESIGNPRERADAVLLRRMRLAPVLSLEEPLRRALGVIGNTSGVSAPSLQAHARSTLDVPAGSSSPPLSWRMSIPLPPRRASLPRGTRHEEEGTAEGDDGAGASSPLQTGRSMLSYDALVLPARWSQNVASSLRRTKSCAGLKRESVDEELTMLIRERKAAQEAVELIACSKDEVLMPLFPHYFQRG
jgi:hypothetical protein